MDILNLIFKNGEYLTETPLNDITQKINEIITELNRITPYINTGGSGSGESQGGSEGSSGGEQGGETGGSSEAPVLRIFFASKVPSFDADTDPTTTTVSNPFQMPDGITYVIPEVRDYQEPKHAYFLPHYSNDVAVQGIIRGIKDPTRNMYADDNKVFEMYSFIYSWLKDSPNYSTAIDPTEHPERYLGSTYKLETRLRVDSPNYDIQCFLKNDNGWLTSHEDDANQIIVENAPTKFQVANDPGRFGGTFDTKKYSIPGYTEDEHSICDDSGNYYNSSKYSLMNGSLLRYDVIYGGNRLKPLSGSEKVSTSSLHYMNNTVPVAKITNTEGDYNEFRYSYAEYRPVTIQEDPRMSLAVGVIRDDDNHTKWNKICTSAADAGEVIDDALLNDYDPRVRYIWQIFNRSELWNVLYYQVGEGYDVDSASTMDSAGNRTLDTITLDPGNDYQIRKLKENSNYNVDAPVRVIDIINDYFAELLLDYFEPSMPWNQNGATDNSETWKVNVKPGESLLDMKWLANNEDYSLQETLSKISEDRYEQRLKIATAVASVAKNRDGSSLSSDQKQALIDKYMSGWSHDTNYDEINFSGSLWKNLTSRSTVKNIIQGFNKTDVRNALKSKIVNFLNVYSRQDSLVNNIQDGNVSQYTYGVANNFQKVTRSQWETLVAETKTANTSWNIEKFRYFVYYKPTTGDYSDRYRIVYACCRDNKTKYFVMCGEALNHESKYAYGNMTDEWTTWIKRCAFETDTTTGIYNGQDSTYSGQQFVEWIDKSMFQQCVGNATNDKKVFWFRHFADGEDGWEKRFIWQQDGNGQYVSLFDYSLYGEQIGDYKIMSPYTPSDITESDGVNAHGSVSGWVSTTKLSESIMSYACRTKFVTPLALGELDAEGVSYQPKPRGYGYIITGTYAVTDSSLETHLVNNNTSYPDRVAGGFIIDHRHTTIDNQSANDTEPCSQCSVSLSAYPKNTLFQQLLDQISNSGYNITTKSPQMTFVRILQDLWRRKLKELSIMYYDQHRDNNGNLPENIDESNITNKYESFYRLDMYSNDYEWVNTTLLNSIGDFNAISRQMYINGEFEIGDEGDDIMPRLSKEYCVSETSGWTDTYFGIKTEGPCNEGQGSWHQTPGSMVLGDGARQWQSSGMTVHKGDIFVIMRNYPSSINDNTIVDIWLTPTMVFGNDGHFTFSHGLDQVVEGALNWNSIADETVQNSGLIEWGCRSVDPSSGHSGDANLVPIQPQEVAKGTDVGRYGGNYSMGAFVAKEDFTIYQMHLGTLYTYHESVSGTQYRSGSSDCCGYNATSFVGGITKQMVK